jgi:aryl-alcohol dehydrogenase-like predicted oxidoreductase
MEVGLGCARLGSAARGHGWRDSVRLVHAAIDHGVVYFDTADAYGAGLSERVLGRALRRRRSAVTIATKGGYRFNERGRMRQALRQSAAAAAGRLRVANPGRSPIGGSSYASQDFSPGYLTQAVEGSLRRLATEHIDVYQLHGPRIADLDEVAEWASRMVASGRIGCLGVGAEDLDQARTWLSCAAVASVQVPFGLLDVDAGADVIPNAHASGRRVVARGVFGAGLLLDPDGAGAVNAHKVPVIEALRTVAAQSGTTLSALAVDFVRAHSDVDVILVGTGSSKHLAEVATRVGTAPPDPSLLVTVGATLAAYRGALT